MTRSRTRGWLVGATAAALAAFAALPALSLSAPVPPSGATDASRFAVRPVPASATQRLTQHEFTSLPDARHCQDALGIACYSAAQLRTVYGVRQLGDLDGTGTTIAVVVSYGSPTLSADLTAFDHAMALPDPPSLRTITPAGIPAPFDPADSQMAAWAYETTLDVEYAHAMAPGAALLVVATPVPETEGVEGFPEIMAAERYVIDNGLTDVISQSFGATETTFPDRGTVDQLRAGYELAADRHVTVLASAGDTGPTGYESDLATLSPQRSATWPASDPLVTAVGGTALRLDPSGSRTADDTVWRDRYGAGGGGSSVLFDRPAFQDKVQPVVGGSRGVPDVAMSSAIDGGALVYTSYDPHDTGWSVVGGTSESTPLFAGVIALAVERAGHRLGDLNPALYRLGGEGRGFRDVTSGDNSFGGVAGYSAGPGYDLASGWGTIDARQFVPDLVAALDQ
jgi:subtilase family serine protease